MLLIGNIQRLTVNVGVRQHLWRHTSKGPEPASPAPAGDIADLNNPADRVQVEGNRYNDEHMALVEQ
jgi:hypothetical protein